MVRALALSLVLAVSACGDDDESSESSVTPAESVVESSSELDARAAAATVQDLIETGQRISTEPGACPYGPASELAMLLPKQVEVTPAMRAGDVDDDGQFWFGAPAIVYCPIRASDAGLDVAAIDELRVDVAAGPAEVLDYLDQNFETVAEEDLERRADLLDGNVVAVCHDVGCTAVWQREKLFVALTLVDGAEPSATIDQAEASLEAVTPFVVDALTTLGEQRDELTAVAQSHWAEIYDDLAWEAWDAMVLSGNRDLYQQWLEYEVNEATITQEEANQLLDLLEALP